MIELRIAKIPAMTPDGRFMIAPEDAESIRMQVLREDVRNTLEGYADFDSLDGEESQRFQRCVRRLLSDEALLDVFIRRMDDGHCWSMAELVLTYDDMFHSWDYAPAEEKAVKDVFDEIL